MNDQSQLSLAPRGEDELDAGTMLPIKAARFLQNRGWELEPVDPEKALEIAESRQELLQRVRKIALGDIEPTDVTVRNDRCLIEISGCERIRNTLGIVIMPQGDGEVRQLDAGHEEYRFVVNAFSPITRMAVFGIEGIRATSEGFFKKKADKGGMPEAKAHARRAARQQADRRAIESLAGVRNLSPATIEEAAGFTIPPKNYIEYEAGKKGGAKSKEPDPGFEKARDEFGAELLDYFGDADKVSKWLFETASFDGDKGRVEVKTLADIKTAKWLAGVKRDFAKEKAA